MDCTKFWAILLSVFFVNYSCANDNRESTVKDNDESCAVDSSEYCGEKELNHVEINNEYVLDLLRNSILPQAIKWDRKSSEYDFYVRMLNDVIDGYPSNTIVIFDLESTNQVPLDLESKCSYTIVDDYILFLDKKFTEYYTHPVGDSKSFKYDGRDEREEPEASYWSFYVIGDDNKLEFQNDTRMRYMESVEYIKLRSKKLDKLYPKFGCYAK